MYYGQIKTCDIANGPGVRTTLFVSGCRHHCEGCFQPETWDFEYGKPFDRDAMAAVLAALRPDWISGLSILGGDPMEPENQKALLPFLHDVRWLRPDKTIWLYTGDVYEELLDGPRRTEWTDSILACVDVLVDGPFVEDLKNITLRFRGSENQRIIDMNATRAVGEVRLWDDDPEFSTHQML